MLDAIINAIRIHSDAGNSLQKNGYVLAKRKVFYFRSFLALLQTSDPKDFLTRFLTKAIHSPTCKEYFKVLLPMLTAASK